MLAPILAFDGLGATRRLFSEVGGASAAAATTQGQVIVAVGMPPGGTPSPGLTEGRADGDFPGPRPLTGALGPVACATGYLGDVALAWVSGASGRGRDRHGPSIVLAVQRHFASAPVVQGRYPIGTPRVSALRVTLDYRSDALLTWAQSGRLRARFVPAAGAPGPIQTLGSSAASPALAALVSDDGRAIVAWVSQHVTAAGLMPAAYVYLSISGPGVRFSAPRLLERFREPAVSALPATALALVRLSTESVTMAWTGLDGGGRYVVRGAPVGLPGVGPVSTLSDPGSDALLAALAPGPRADAVAVWTVPGAGSTASVAARQLVPSFTRPRLGPLLALTTSGPYADPAAAIDPDTDRALVAWRAADQPSGLEHALLEPGWSR